MEVSTCRYNAYKEYATGKVPAIKKYAQVQYLKIRSSPKKDI